MSYSIYEIYEIMHILLWLFRAISWLRFTFLNITSTLSLRIYLQISVCVRSVFNHHSLFIIHGQFVSHGWYKCIFILWQCVCDVCALFYLSYDATNRALYIHIQFIEKHVYRVGTIHYPLRIMSRYISSSLLLFYRDCIICMLFIVRQ